MDFEQTVSGQGLIPDYKLGPKHILKGLIGGALIGLIGVFFPETLFWAEYEAQTIISKGANPLPHVNPSFSGGPRTIVHPSAVELG